MDYKIWQKIKMWLCDKLGHKININNIWYHQGVHCACERCGHVQSNKNVRDWDREET